MLQIITTPPPPEEESIAAAAAREEGEAPARTVPQVIRSLVVGWLQYCMIVFGVIYKDSTCAFI
ncbi:hypothetical protein QJS10_CPB04g00053 [Acorus calamus]|uniref:Uncharacterized protein n=1 Tax=Acorus calamus TaxID=4465 RepID=A0AAV9F2C1_ACOCL|nr:hypothetical protein QJS10_CPB04g00053 [Acorus calamus]